MHIFIICYACVANDSEHSFFTSLILASVIFPPLSGNTVEASEEGGMP